MKKTLIVLFSLSIISCGGGSSSSPDMDNAPIAPPQTYPTHPLVWDVVTPESVGMSSSGLEQAFDYVFQDGFYTSCCSNKRWQIGL